MADDECLLCDADRAAGELNREVVWEDELWRLAMTHRGYTTGFGYLEPKRHVPRITDLDGEERIVSRDFPEMAADEIATVIERARKLLS